jgi:hypothetical protein
VLIEISIFVLLLLGGIVYGTYSSVHRMSASPQLVPAPELMAQINPSLPTDVTRFLLANRFRPLECYRFHQLRLVIWTQPGSQPLQSFCLMKSPTGNHIEFEAVFSDDAALTTTRSRSAFMFPRFFGSFVQSFPKSSIERLWDLHLKGTQHLISSVAIPIRESHRPVPERSRRAIVRQLSLVRSLPLWPLRGVYWFLIKRFLLQNRPVWKQDLARLYHPVPSIAELPT